MTYKIGVVYVWQNMDHELACLNGTECTVTGPEQSYWNGIAILRGWPTDSLAPGWKGATVMAWPGNLRRKQPPTGEIAIMRMFDVTAPAPREVEAA